jgi:hypothetical protein
MWSITHDMTETPGWGTGVALSILVDGAAPFVFTNDVFQQVSSPADMSLLPEDTGNEHRRSSMTLLFRHPDHADRALDTIMSELEDLWRNTLTEAEDEVLFTMTT